MVKKKNSHNGLFRLIRSFTEQLGASSVLLLSNGMVYSSLIAIVPALTLIYSALNLFGVLDPVMSAVEQYVIQFFGAESGGVLVGYFRTFTANAMGMGVLSMLSFAVTFILLIDKVFAVINKIYHTENSRNIVLRYLKYLFVMILVIAAIVISVVLITRFNTIALRLRGLPAVEGAEAFLGAILPYAMTFILMNALITLIPGCRVRLGSSLVGATFGTVGITVLVKVFRMATVLFVRNSIIYGSMATLMFSFMFLSFFWKVVFASVLLAYVHQCQHGGVQYTL